MSIGVILVAYRTGDVLSEALEALVAAAEHPGGPDLRVLVIDNASPDGTIGRLRSWGEGRPLARPPVMPVPAPRGRAPIRIDFRDLAADGPHPRLGTISEGVVGALQAGSNGGFAAAVNLGLGTFSAMPEVEAFWILNSDAMTEPQTPARLIAEARARNGRYAAIGGRVVLTDPPGVIQSDGGRVDLWLGRLRPHGLGAADPDLPGPAGGTLEYVHGAHMLVGRAMLERAGPMPDEYFLYYEEVDWAMRRGDLPLIWVPGAAVHHRNGSSIGSERLNAGPSRLSAYWMYRNRVRFVARWNPAGVPTTLAYCAFKVARYARRRQWPAVRGATAGILGAAGPARRPRPPVSRRSPSRPRRSARSMPAAPWRRRTSGRTRSA
ncbi:MAG: glycosyltransferase family 2 protein [Hasllibacter sp.]